MTASSTDLARSPESLRRLRSRGGRDAGCSDQPGRSNPPETASHPNIPTAESILTAKSALMEQRGFRTVQLQELDTVLPDADSDPALAEVHLELRAAARSTLRDIEVALRRIRQGSYGRCPRCGDTMSVDLLRALPMARLCGRCQRVTAIDAAVESDLR